MIYFKNFDDMLDKTFEMAMLMERDTLHVSNIKPEYFFRKLEHIRNYLYEEYMKGNVDFVNEDRRTSEFYNKINLVLAPKKK